MGERIEELHPPLRDFVVRPVGQLGLVESVRTSDTETDLVNGRVGTLFICKYRKLTIIFSNCFL